MPAPRRQIARRPPLGQSDALTALRVRYFLEKPLEPATDLERDEVIGLRFALRGDHRRNAWATVRSIIKTKVPAKRFAQLEAEFAAGLARDFFHWRQSC